MNHLDHPKLLQFMALYENPREMIMLLEFVEGCQLVDKVAGEDFSLTEQVCEIIQSVKKVQNIPLSLNFDITYELYVVYFNQLS